MYPHGWSQLVSPRFKISQQNIALREHENIEGQELFLSTFMCLN
jgi:hypothetical protein